MSATSTASAREFFVLGKENSGNRELVVVESGDTYSMDYSTVVAYTDQTAQFPYEI